RADAARRGGSDRRRARGRRAAARRGPARARAQSRGADGVQQEQHAPGRRARARDRDRRHLRRDRAARRAPRRRHAREPRLARARQGRGREHAARLSAPNPQIFLRACPRMERRPSTVALLSLALLVAPALVAVPPASAATGDVVGVLSFSKPCSSGIGVGIAMLGFDVWYTCYLSGTDLYRANATTGAVTASYGIAGGLGALTYDASRNGFWIGGGRPADTNVYFVQLDPSYALVDARVAFKGAVQSGSNLVDGLAWDPSDDTLYYSPDVSQTIYHYSTNGTLLS